MIARIENRIGISVDIPHYDGRKFQYHQFFMDKAGRVICQNVMKRKWIVPKPYTITKHWLGTDEVVHKEVI